MLTILRWVGFAMGWFRKQLCSNVQPLYLADDGLVCMCYSSLFLFFSLPASSQGVVHRFSVDHKDCSWIKKTKKKQWVKNHNTFNKCVGFVFQVFRCCINSIEKLMQEVFKYFWQIIIGESQYFINIPYTIEGE